MTTSGTSHKSFKIVSVITFLILLLGISSLYDSNYRNRLTLERPKLTLNLLGTYQTGIFDEGAAEISAYDPITERLFVSNADLGSIDVLSISDPTSPQLLFSIIIEDFISSGGVTSVDVFDGKLAAAIDIDDSKGKVLVFSTDMQIPVELLNSYEVGYLPDMLTFTEDGSYILVANEAEPMDDGTFDPQGSISIIEMSTNSVYSVDFTKFNGKEEELRNKGVRILPGNTAANDLEPEFISIAPEGDLAFITLQENNAFAILDIPGKSIIDVIPLGYKNHNLSQPALSMYPFEEAPLSEELQISFGGLSGLYFEGYNENRNPVFITVPDRGPNGDPTEVSLVTNPEESVTVRPFLLPDYQAEIIRFEIDGKQINILDKIPLTRQDGLTPISGLPNIEGTDEIPAVPVQEGGSYQDNAGNQYNLISYDPYGADLEGIVIDQSDNSYWMVDEYRPSIYHFNSDGLLIDRFIPIGTAALAGVPAGTFGTESLPEVYSSRRANRGFEALAFNNQTGILYAFIQTPLANPDRQASDNSNIIRILGIDSQTGQPVSEFIYVLEKNVFSDQVVDKIGDAVYDEKRQKILVIERDSRISHYNKKPIFEIDLKGATNILGMSFAQPLETMSVDQLAIIGVNPVHKLKLLNLPSIGYLPSDKPEGLAILPNGDLAVLNDNDFGLAGAEVSESVLGIIHLQQPRLGNGLDASDRDNEINITNWPILGMYQPDAITSFSVNGESFFATANEGDARDYDFYAEEVRIKDDDIVLDNDVFPNGDELKEDENIGRLNVTTQDGDIDNDGDFDQLFVFGSRSFSIWDAYGNLVFDSGDMIEKIVASYFPDHFNANNDENDFDSRSDNKGPEPEGITYGSVGGKHYLFIGLERVGGIMIFEVGNPFKPKFIDYINNRSFTSEITSPLAGDLGPEGLTFVSAENSPVNSPLLIVTNEISGSTTIYEISTPAGNPETRFVSITEKSPLKIFPNPAKDQIQLKIEGQIASKTVVVVKDFNNKILLKKQFINTGETFSMNTSGLKPGQYIVEVQSDGTLKRSRLIKN